MSPKTNILLKQNQKLFHTNDLAVLWSTKTSHNVRMTASRYIKNGTFIPVQRGLYSTVPLDKLDPYELGASVLHSYCYVSTESILVREGIIFQGLTKITFVSQKSSTFTVGKHTFLSRKMKDSFLFNDAGIVRVGDHYEATLERAIADMLYYDPTYYFDAHEYINWKKVKEIQKKVGYV